MAGMWSFLRFGVNCPATPPIAPVVALLAVRNVVEVPLPDAVYVPLNVALGAVLLELSRRWGLAWHEVGFDRRHLPRAFTVGGAAAFLAAGAMLIGAVTPLTRGLFDDGRIPAEASGWERLYQTAVRIPLGTVAFEELAFRGVLLAVLSRRFSVGAAVVVNSALFGLWHILPTLATARANGIVGIGRVGLVAGSVLVTFVGGLVFCALRRRGGHLLAPALLHLALNDAGYLLAWWTRS